MLAIDLFGSLPETRARNNVVLVMTEYFTGWCNAIPLPDGKAATVGRVLDERDGIGEILVTRIQKTKWVKISFLTDLKREAGPVLKLRRSPQTSPGNDYK